MRSKVNHFSSLAVVVSDSLSALSSKTNHLTQPDSPVSITDQSSCLLDMATVAKQRLPETIRVEFEAKVEKQPMALTSSELSERKQR